jgi:hypothetical protein
MRKINITCSLSHSGFGPKGEKKNNISVKCGGGSLDGGTNRRGMGERRG